MHRLATLVPVGLLVASVAVGCVSSTPPSPATGDGSTVAAAASHAPGATSASPTSAHAKATAEAVTATRSGHRVPPLPASAHGEVPQNLASFVAGVHRTFAAIPPLEMTAVWWDEWYPEDHWYRWRWDGNESATRESRTGESWTLDWLRTAGRTYELRPRSGNFEDISPAEGAGPPGWPYQLPQDCRDGWQHRGFDMVAERPAHHVACGRQEFWLDEESQVVTRVHGGQSFWEVTSLAFAPQPASRFALPSGAVAGGESPPTAAPSAPSRVSNAPTRQAEVTLVGTTWTREDGIWNPDGSGFSIVRNLMFTADGQIHVEVGCGSGAGRVTVEGAVLHVADFVLTENGCSSGTPAEWAADETIRAVLAAETIAYAITAGRLELRAGSEVVRFTASESPPWAPATEVPTTLVLHIDAGHRYDSMNFTEPFEFVMPVARKPGSWGNLGVTEESLGKGVLAIGNKSSWKSVFLDDVPVYSDACGAGRDLLEDIPATPEAVEAWLRSSPRLTVGDAIAITVDGRTALAFPTTPTETCGLNLDYRFGGVVYAIPTGDDTILYIVWSDGGDWQANEFPDQLVASITFKSAAATPTQLAGTPSPAAARRVANGWIAYSVSSDIYLVREGTEPHRVVGLPTDRWMEEVRIIADGDGTLRFCPTFSPDGSMLAWTETETTLRNGEVTFGAHTIVVAPIDPDGNVSDRPTILTLHAAPVHGFGRCAAWAPDGKRLAVYSLESSALQVVSLDGTIETVLPFDMEPQFSWSPDGSALAVGTYLPPGVRVSRPDGSSVAVPNGVWVVQVTGGATRTLELPAESFKFNEIAWSPVDDRIAVSWSTRDPNGNDYDATDVAGRFIRIFRADGSVDTDITIPIDDQPYVPFPSPLWSPDGTRIAWLQRVHSTDGTRRSFRPDLLGGLEIVISAPDGSDRVVVFSSQDVPMVRGRQLDGFGPVGWSPDGKRLLVRGDVEDPTDCSLYTLLTIAADAASPPVVLVSDIGGWCRSDLPEVSWQAVPR